MHGMKHEKFILVQYTNLFCGLYNNAVNKLPLNGNMTITNPINQSPSWKANSSTDSRKIPQIWWSPKVHRRVLNECPAPVSVLSHINSLHAHLFYFSTVHFDIILPSTSRSSRRSLSLWLPLQERWLLDDAFKRIWKSSVVPWFDEPYQHLSGKTLRALSSDCLEVEVSTHNLINTKLQCMICMY
jgi:hypothetical protein